MEAQGTLTTSAKRIATNPPTGLSPRRDTTKRQRSPNAAAPARKNARACGGEGVCARCLVQLVSGEGELAPDLEPQDCILYLDVLEHIADDRAEMKRAAARLAPGGRLVVLAPAHQALFSVFDRAVGHHRRYDRKSLRALTLPELELRTLRYVDAADADKPQKVNARLYNTN